MFEFFKGTVTPKDWAIVGILLAVTAVIFAAFYFVVLDNRKQQVEVLSAELKDIEAQLRIATQYKQNLPQLERDELQMGKLVEGFQSRLPDKREIQGLLEKFERYGDSLGLRIVLTYLPTTTDKHKQTLPYKITAYGNYHQIASFINLLEREQRYLKISDVDIGEEEEGVAEATFVLSTFIFIQQPEGAAT